MTKRFYSVSEIAEEAGQPKHVVRYFLDSNEIEPEVIVGIAKGYGDRTMGFVVSHFQMLSAAGKYGQNQIEKFKAGKSTRGGKAAAERVAKKHASNTKG